MAQIQPLIFQVGQLVESRSFVQGYRGAWFRCEIKDVAWNGGQIRYCVKYCDYVADGLEWIELYQVDHEGERVLMLRPKFPPICEEIEPPTAVPEVTIVVDGSWSLGDKVDWLSGGCYWSGTVTEVVGDDTVKVTSPDEPTGEGGNSTVSCKDLRPSLGWSPYSGWTFSVRVEDHNGHAHARLIQPA